MATKAASREKVITVRCTGTELIDPSKLQPFQGSFKAMSSVDLERLREQLKKEGVTAASTVWRQKLPAGESLFLLDGHQRREALLSLRLSGWKVPPIPVNFTECRDATEARRTVMALASTYGRVNQAELADFAAAAELTLPQAEQLFSFPDVDLAEMVKDLQGGSGSEGGRSVNFTVKPTKKVSCPKCSHKFVPEKS